MKPETLKDLLAGGHLDKSDIRKIAREIFDGETTAAGPDGYVITAVSFDDLPEHVQGFIIKAILEFRVRNVLEDQRDEDGGEDSPVTGSPFEE